LIFALRHTLALIADGPYRSLYYPVVISYGFLQGLVWTGLWVIAHECGHSAFSTNSIVNDAVGWTIHSALLTPYFSWKSTHRRHHIYANHMDKDLNYVPLRRDGYAAKMGLKPDRLGELGEDAPIVLFLRIMLQQLIGWNWYILSNITSPPTALIKPGMSVWRHSHFDPWGALFRDSERTAIILSDIGCLLGIIALHQIHLYLGSFGQVFWLYIIPWMWVNHWIGVLAPSSPNPLTLTAQPYPSYDHISAPHLSERAQIQRRVVDFHPRRYRNN
jgi:omega-6 fatty acid desaturase (delta-12 desaturase)